MSKIKIGDTIISKYFKGRTKVVSINETTNELSVSITNIDNYCWDEIWDLQHTIWGLESGDYFFEI